MNIVEWLKKESRVAVGVLVFASVAMGAFLLNGCDLGDVIKVDTPYSLQQEGVPPKLTLNEAEYEYEAWHAEVQREGIEWRNRIGRGNEIAGLVRGMAIGYVDSYSPALGPASLFVSGIAGLFLGRAGQRKEKEESYAKGRKDTLATVKGAAP